MLSLQVLEIGQMHVHVGYANLLVKLWYLLSVGRTVYKTAGDALFLICFLKGIQPYHSTLYEVTKCNSYMPRSGNNDSVKLEAIN